MINILVRCFAQYACCGFPILSNVDNRKHVKDNGEVLSVAEPWRFTII